MFRRGWHIGVLIVAVSFVTTACSSSSSSTTSVAGSSGGTTADVSGASSTEISTQDFFFTPANLTGTAGQKVTITVSNDGSAAHNFSITDQDIDVTVQPGQSQDVKVVFPDSGSVEFFCSFHQSQGMVGTLAVA
jgi:plastocyanin